MNETDAAGRSACREQAQADKKDALSQCDAQFSARQKICKYLGGQSWDLPVDLEQSPFLNVLSDPGYGRHCV
jgi:hypothetical protein